MTSDPAAPDAPAVYLNREEIVDDKLHFHQVYARVKILTEKGKQDFADIEIPYEAGASNVRNVEGRTIHADGTVIPFTGKPYQKELVKHGDVKIMAKVFSMPDVQVGSIVEYRWELSYEDNYVIPPSWDLQQSVFVHKSHYHFVASESRYLTHRDARGHEDAVNRLLYYHNLPSGAEVREGFGGYDLTLENIPALPDEDYSPPQESYDYRLIFYYSPARTGGEFWKTEGKRWSKDVDRFANPDGVRQAVDQIVAPGDTDDQKLHKIYAAVMQLENTRFTRQRSAAENKAEGVRVKTAADIWQQKRGSDDEITLLFIAMARAAGMKAYAMAVTERDKALLNVGYLDWSQLEDDIAIVQVGGKDVYFDPGQRYCDYGKLHWMHTQMAGVRQTDGGTEMVVTPAAEYRDNAVLRTADLQLGADGQLTGTVRIMMSGAEALRWRQRALRSDEQETKKDFESFLQRDVPDGVQVRTNHFVGLTDNSAPLMAVLDVSGSLGTATGKRIFLPSAFFQARSKPIFSEEKRETTIDLRYPSLAQDHVVLKLASGLTIESMPKAADVPLPQAAEYRAQYGTKGDIYEQVRMMALGNTVFKKEAYPDLRTFFQKAGAQDQQQVVLTRVAVATTDKSSPGKSE